MKRLLLSIGFLILISCNNTRNNKFLNSWLGTFEKNIDYVMVLPNAGCNSCISSAEQFLIDNNAKTENMKIVFTGSISMKSIKNRFGNDFLDRKNIYLDSLNLFLSNNIVSVYPIIIYNYQNKLTIKEISPLFPSSLDSLQLVLNSNNF